jgi:hypothetical protein
MCENIMEEKELRRSSQAFGAKIKGKNIIGRIKQSG